MSDLNLKNEYEMLNNLIFNNQLPEDMPVKWNHSKTCLGKTRIKYSSNIGFSFKITISNFFLCSDKEYIETLIHEMIHVHMAVNGDFRKDNRVHGPLFKKYMHDINIQFPQYNIKIKENKKLHVDESRILIQNGFFLITEDNKKYFNLYKHELDQKIIKRVIMSLSSIFRIKNGNVYIFRGKYPELASAPVRKNLKTLSGKLQYLHNKEDMEELYIKIIKEFPQKYSIGGKISFFNKKAADL